MGSALPRWQFYWRLRHSDHRLASIPRPEDASALPPNIWAHAPTPGGRACWWIRILRPWGNVGRANLAPDASGISYYDQALFLEIMHASQVTSRKLNPIMPIKVYKDLTDDDLKAMFAYLRALKSVKHHVDNSEPATPCKRCKQKHGAGAED